MDLLELGTRAKILDHSAVADALAVMRASDSPAIAFRGAVRLIARALAYEATRHLPLMEVEIETPLERTAAKRLCGRIVAAPILRAGLWMLDGFLDIVPSAVAGFIGLRRNESTLAPEEYYRNVPNLAGAHLFLLDPMLATGGSIVAALEGLPLENVASVSVLSMIGAPEGVARVSEAYPDVTLHLAAVDRQLSDIGYILPGLGDAGDRLCGTC